MLKLVCGIYPAILSSYKLSLSVQDLIKDLLKFKKIYASYPFTAPIVIPAINHFWKIIKIIRIGTTVIIIAAL